VVVLMILRDDECLLTPDDDVVLASGDELLLAGLRVQGDGRPVRDVRTGHDRHD
jgi:K+/H+ antiporter YhaU regulatory subunit KhtT